MKKYLVLGCAVLLVLTAAQMVWAGGYVVVVPRQPVVVYTPGMMTTTLVVEEPAVVIPYDRYYDTRYHRGYMGHRYPPNPHAYRAPLPYGGRPCASAGSAWGFSAGTRGRR
jgi:hypothetical protein